MQSKKLSLKPTNYSAKPLCIKVSKTFLLTVGKFSVNIIKRIFTTVIGFLGGFTCIQR